LNGCGDKKYDAAAFEELTTKAEAQRIITQDTLLDYLATSLAFASARPSRSVVEGRVKPAMHHSQRKATIGSARTARRVGT